MTSLRLLNTVGNLRAGILLDAAESPTTVALARAQGGILVTDDEYWQEHTARGSRRPSPNVEKALDQALKNHLLDRVATETAWKPTVRAATTAVLPAHTRDGNTMTATVNGALAAQDGVTLIDDDVLLVMHEGGGSHLDNGPHRITQGTAATPWKLERVSWFDVSSEAIKSALIGVREGTKHGQGWFSMTTTGAIVLNTTALSFQRLFGYGTSGVTRFVEIGAADTDTWLRLPRSATDQPNAGMTVSDFIGADDVVDQVLWVGHNVGIGAREDATKVGFWDAWELKFVPTPGHQGLFERFSQVTYDDDTSARPWGFTASHDDKLVEVGFNGQTTFLDEAGVTQYALVERTTGAIVSRAGTAPKFYAEGVNRVVLAADKQGGGGAQTIVETVSNTQIRIGGAPSWTRTTFAGECHFAQECFFDGGIDVPANQYITADTMQLLGRDNFSEAIVGSASHILIPQASNGGGHGVFWNIGGINATMRNEGWSIGNGSTVVRAGLLLDLVSTTRALGVPMGTTAQKNAINPGASARAVFWDTTLNKLCIWNGAAWETVTSA